MHEGLHHLALLVAEQQEHLEEVSRIPYSNNDQMVDSGGPHFPIMYKQHSQLLRNSRLQTYGNVTIWLEADFYWPNISGIS